MINLKTNRGLRNLIPTLFSMIFGIMISYSAHAQCDNLGINLTATNSTCQANGVIRAKFAGADTVNILPSTVLYKIDNISTGQNYVDWTTQPSGGFSGLPPGIYKVFGKATCSQGGAMVEHSDSITITGDYKVMEASISGMTPSMNCVDNGVMPVMITAGLAPYTVTVTSSPAGYSGPAGFNPTAAGTFRNLAQSTPGQYVITVSDKCAHTVVLNPTVPALSSDFPAAADKPFNETLNAPFSPDGANCNTVGIYFDRLDPNHELFTFWNEASKYYEVGFVVNGSGSTPSSWVSAVNVYNRVIFAMPAGNTYKSMRDADNFLIPHIRVKNPKPGAANCQVALTTQLKLKTPPFQFITKYEDMTCDHFTIRFQPEVTQEGVWCYPYKWHIENVGGTQVFPPSGTVSSPNRAEQTATQIPYGSTIHFEDKEGFTWYWNIPARQPDKNGIRMAYNSSFCMPNTGKSYIYIGMKDYTLKAGTRIKYISGPTRPYHLEFTTNADIQNFIYPYSYRNGVHTPQQYEDILPGTYEFEVEDCGGVMRVTTEVRQYTVSGFSVANQQHTCEGLKVTPAGNILDNGSPWETYYSIQSGPPGVNYDSTGVARGGSLILPVTGTYTIKITHDRATSQTGACPAAILSVSYSRNTLRMDPNITAAYKCKSELTGFIRIKGMYGGPDGTGSTYKYELKSGSTVLLSNSSGEFRYGNGGDVFTVVVSDEICRTSFEQQVSVYDLSLAGAASGSRDVCTGETIRLYSINLGNTTYNWTGPGGWSSTQRNPVITNATAAMSGDYILSVTPQSCSETVRDTISVTVAPRSPKPVASNINPAYCQNAVAPSLETASGATALPGYVLEWLRSDGTVITPPNPIVTGVVGETVYKVRQRPASGTGCTSEDSVTTITVTISPIPASQLSVTQSINCGDTVFTLVVSPAAPGYYYNVYDENGIFLKRSATGSGEIRDIPVPDTTRTYTVSAVVEKGGCETPETLRTRIDIGTGDPTVPKNIVPSIVQCGATKFDVTVTPAQAGVSYRLYNANLVFVKASAVGSGVIDNIDFPPSPPDSAYFYVSAVIGGTCETPSSDWERILVRSGGRPMAPPKASITTKWNCGDSIFSLTISPVSTGYYYKLYRNTVAFDSTAVGSGVLSGIPVPKNSSEVYYLSSVLTSGNDICETDSRYRTKVDIEEDLPDSPLPPTLYVDSLQCSGSSFNIIVRPAKPGYYYRVHVPPLNAVIDSSAVVPVGDTVAVIRNLPAPLVPETWYVSAVVDTGRCMSPRVTPIYVNPNTQGASPSDIDVAGASACMGMPTTLIASSTTVQNPVFRWYAHQTSTDTLHEGPMFVTDSLTQTTTYYVSVSGDGYCENPPGARKEVTVNINPPSSPLDISVTGDTVICSGNFATLIASSTSVMNPLFRWYPNYTSDLVLSYDSIYRTATQINSNDQRVYTQVYVAVYGDDFCETAKSDRKEVLVAIKRNGDGSLIGLDPTTANDTVICSGRTATLKVASTVPDPVFNWYDSQSSTTPLHVGDTFTTPPLDTTTTYYVTVSSFHICENSARKAITVTVHPSLPGDIDITSKDTTVCVGGTVTLSVSSSRPGVIFRWYLERTSDSVVYTGADYTVTLSRTTSFFVGIATASATDSCETAPNDRKEVIAKVHEVYPGTISIAGDSTVCSGNTPGTLSISGATGGTGNYTYLWQSRQDYSATWTDHTTGLTYQPGPIFDKTHFRVKVSDGTCSENLSDSVTIDVLADGVGAYPDVRVSICSDVSALNLSKYVDTLGIHSLRWAAMPGSASITPSGDVSVSELNKSRSHTYIYTASNVCVTDNASRLYLRVINGNFNFLLDTVAVCYLNAEAMNINQIFGIEADGVIIVDGGSALDPYIRKISSGDHAGAVIFNGRSAYLEPGLLPEINYHGEMTKQVTFRYASSASGCLKGREFRIVVVLTPDITK